jgi:hypothetical protein
MLLSVLAAGALQGPGRDHYSLHYINPPSSKVSATISSFQAGQATRVVVASHTSCLPFSFSH